MEIAEIPEFKSNRMTQMQSSGRRKNLALSCTFLCALGAATTLLPNGMGPFARLVSGRKLRASKQRRLQLAAADYSALLAANSVPPVGSAVPAMGAPAMGAAPVDAGTMNTAGGGGGGGELSDADIAKFLAKYDLELKDLELLQKLREGYVKADGTSATGSSASASSVSTSAMAMATGAAPPVPEPPATPAAPPVDYAAMLGTPATSSVSAPEVAAAPAAPATSSASTPLAVPLGPVEDCSLEADNWLQNFCELKNYKNRFGDANVS